jgi:hypothetical protein
MIYRYAMVLVAEYSPSYDVAIVGGGSAGTAGGSFRDGWIKPSYNPKLPLPTIQGGVPALRLNTDNKPV